MLTGRIRLEAGGSGRLRRSLLLVLLLAFLLPALPVEAKPWYARSYDRGMSMFRRGHYRDAIRHFRELLDISRTNDLSDNCQFWIGECYYQLGEYEQAIIEFDRTLTFPGTNKREDALYKLADCHRRLGKREDARQLYLRLLAEYPKTRHSPYVLKTLEKLEAR